MPLDIMDARYWPCVSQEVPKNSPTLEHIAVIEEYRLSMMSRHFPSATVGVSRRRKNVGAPTVHCLPCSQDWNCWKQNSASLSFCKTAAQNSASAAINGFEFETDSKSAAAVRPSPKNSQFFVATLPGTKLPLVFTTSARNTLEKRDRFGSPRRFSRLDACVSKFGIPRHDRIDDQIQQSFIVV